MKTSRLFRRKNISKSWIADLDQLIWELCKSILHSPVKCNSWSFAFCQSCYDKFENEVGCCPKMCIPPKAEKVSKKVLEQLNGLEFKCVNRHNGWPHVAKYKDVVKHYESCEFAVVHCKGHPLWELELLRKNAAQHEKFWKFVKIDCPYWDTKGLIRGQLAKHLEKKWGQVETCKSCGNHVKKGKR